jgi:hypothetical protein
MQRDEARSNGKWWIEAEKICHLKRLHRSNVVYGNKGEEHDEIIEIASDYGPSRTRKRLFA